MSGNLNVPDEERRASVVTENISHIPGGFPVAVIEHPSARALDDLTTKAVENHDAPPEEHIQGAADHATTHSWLAGWIPTSMIQEYEAWYRLGNYVLDRETDEKSWESMSIYVRLGMHMLYYGTYQAQLLHSERVLALLKNQSIKMGQAYDSPESKNHIQPFITSFNLTASMNDMEIPDPNDYPTFNHFFARAIKPSARPVAEPENDHVIVSQADCRMVVFPTIDLATKYWVKGFGFTLENLLRDAELAKEFDGGSLVIARLAPQDYHRWHSPINGTVISVNKIPGAYYTVNPQAICQQTTLDVFCENRRDVMVARRKETGSKVVIVAVGAMLVGSIEWNEGFEIPGKDFKRGECQGAFKYGGSTVLALYPKGEIELDADLVKNSTEKQIETLMRCNWRVGITKQ